MTLGVAMTIGIQYQRHDSWKKKVNKLDFNKIKTFCSANDDIKRIRTQITGWEKMFAEDITEKRLLSKYTRNSWNSTMRKQSNLKNG